jgi:hypothetical protein
MALRRRKAKNATSISGSRSRVTWENSYVNSNSCHERETSRRWKCEACLHVLLDKVGLAERDNGAASGVKVRETDLAGSEVTARRCSSTSQKKGAATW